MMSEGMSAADFAALTNGDGFGANGSWLWFIIVIFCVFGGFGGNGWGNNQYATSADVQRSTSDITTDARFNSLSENQARNAMDNMSLIDRNAMDNQGLIAQNRYDNATLIKDAQYTNLQNTYATTNAINSGFNNVTSQMNQGFNNVQGQLCQGFNGIEKGIMQNTYDVTTAMNNGFAGVQNGLCEISHQISDGVCAIKTQLLQDKYDNLRNEYNLSTMANANSVQTNNILSALGSWYAKPPYAPPVYPYYGTAYAASVIS